MKINVFGKTVEWQGKKFAAYNGRLIRKNGEEFPVTIKFRQECDAPSLKDCPCQIEFSTLDANLVIKTLKDAEGMPMFDANGEVKTSRTLWIKAWKMIGPFVDHSLDDFED